MSGESGSIDDKATIEKLIIQLDRYSLEMMDDQVDIGGCRYFMDLYSGSGKVSRITIVDERIINVDGIYYEVDNSSVDIAAFGEIIESS
ncbi:hypothetical protein [Methanolobus psychrotolerans]|uniref:hypothetical protein n=1 Tax=Methanolobus psychrotolerans TaxID=1874706 RepID=UPI000B916ED9|nr:hypothetical protein [Methanolobus psychrotolerans]